MPGAAHRWASVLGFTTGFSFRDEFCSIDGWSLTAIGASFKSHFASPAHEVLRLTVLFLLQGPGFDPLTKDEQGRGHPGSEDGILAGVTEHYRDPYPEGIQ